MDVELWTKWATLAGAVIAAVSGVWSLLIQLRGKRDSFLLGMGTISPEAIRETCMHVVSISEHPIKIADYGFIELDGRLTSIRMENDLCNYIDQEAVFRGSLTLEKRGDSMEVGYCRNRPAIGCFALTNVQTRPKVAFGYDTPILKRVWVMMKVFWKGEAYLI